MPSGTAQRRINNLVDDIARLYGKVQKSLTDTYWKIGNRLDEEAMAPEVCEAYGDRLLNTVSGRLLTEHGAGFSVDNLQRIRDFCRIYPESPDGLTWNHYVAAERNEKLPRVKKVLPPLERPEDLRLWTFKKAREDLGSLIAAGWHFVQDPVEAERQGAVFLDCGFFVLRAVSEEEAARVIVTEAPSYAYPAMLERVVDGDTLLAVIFTGFGGFVRERLRLRGINTPERKTLEGEEAKHFVEGLLPPGSPLVIKSYRTDNYGRFVVDVFYKPGVASAEEITADGVYLNQEILDKGIAVRMKE